MNKLVKQRFKKLNRAFRFVQRLVEEDSYTVSGVEVGSAKVPSFPLRPGFAVFNAYLHG